MPFLSYLLLATFGSFTADATEEMEYPEFGQLSLEQLAAGTPIEAKPPKSVKKQALPLDDMARATASVEYLAKMEPQPTMRGAMEVQLYKKVAPSVVLVVTMDEQEQLDGMGSGTVISADGEILTNAHVVGHHPWAAVFFKPPSGDRPDGFHVAMVERVDEMTDLAVLRLVNVPSSLPVARIAAPVALDVGLDVHAVGHPEGEVWTYTKGIVSAYRDDYEWQSGGAIHRAAVIQTQTPINPGSSGGGLFNDAGELVGVNSFFMAGAQGMNYAVAAEEVHRILSGRSGRAQPAASAKPSPAENYQAMDLDGDGVEETWMIDKDGDGNYEGALSDTNGDGRFDMLLVDLDGNGKIDVEAYDTDHNDAFDLYGYDYNEDGTVDEYGIDSNEDGTPDYTRRP